MDRRELSSEDVLRCREINMELDGLALVCTGFRRAGICTIVSVEVSSIIAAIGRNCGVDALQDSGKGELL